MNQNITTQQKRQATTTIAALEMTTYLSLTHPPDAPIVWLKLSWPEISKRFLRRSVGSLQVRHSPKLKRRSDGNDGEQPRQTRARARVLEATSSVRSRPDSDQVPDSTEDAAASRRYGLRQSVINSLRVYRLLYR